MTARTPAVGQRVRLIRCSDPYTRLVPGATGTVSFVDDLATVHVDWDDGHQLGLIPDAGDAWEEIPTSTAFTVPSSAIERCPIQALTASHYRPDGTCLCRPESYPKEKPL